MNVPHIRTQRLDLVSMSAEFVEATLAGQRVEAEAIGGSAAPDWWPDEHDARFLRVRLKDLRNDPSAQQWLMRTMVLRDASRTMVGHIGFHGPPRDGFAELGYTVFPQHQRNGYATEAARALMDFARGEHGVRRFRVSISPDNGPSLAMAARLGFTQIGEHMDEVDGLELVFELALP